jgi:hypothetical protein
MKRPIESDYTSHVAYTRALEEYCDALAQPEPEYVAFMDTPQRTWVGLTDEEIKPCWHEACQTDLELTSQLVVYFAKAIEAKLRSKNND